MPEPLITQKMSSVIPATCCTSESWHTSFCSDLYDTPRQGIFRRGGSIKLEVIGRLPAKSKLPNQFQSNSSTGLLRGNGQPDQVNSRLLDARPFDYLLPYAGINRMSCVLEMDITRISSSRAPSLTSCASRLRSCIVSTSPKYVLAVGGHLLQFL